MSGFIPRDFIEQLIARTDLIDIIQERIQLKKAGKNFVSQCPFHQEKTPSFNVSPTKQFYHCFGCGASGNVISFLLDFDRMEFPEAIEFLAHRLSLEIPYEKNTRPNNAPSKQSKLDDFALLNEVAVFYQQQLKTSDDAINYLKSRGINGMTAKLFGIGFAPNRWDAVLKKFNDPEKLLATGMLIQKENEQSYYDRFRNRLMFPIRNTRGQVIGFGGRVLDDSLPKYLNSPETHLFQKNNELYGWFECLQNSRKLQRVFVVEGYLDVVSLAQAGISEVVATLGTATSSEHIQKIARQCPQIVFCFDGDKAGRQAAWRALNSALPVLQDNLHLRFLFLPDGEDPDSYVQKNGAEAFRALADQAMPLSEYFFSHLTEECQLQLAEGRAKFVNLAIPLLAKLPNGAFLRMLCEECAQLSKMDQNSIQKMLVEAKTHHSSFDQITTDTMQHVRLQLTPMRLAIALLIQYPPLAHTEAAQAIQTLPAEFPGTALLQELYQTCLEKNELTTAGLLEAWRERSEFTTLTKLAGQELETSDDATHQQLWKDTLNRLHEQHRQMQIDRLIKKMKENKLSESEHQELMELLHGQN